jgi:hypothetical protein
MKKRMIVVVVAAGIGVMALAMRSTPVAAKSDATAMVTQADVNAVVDARLHELLKQKIAEAHARAEAAASEK